MSEAPDRESKTEEPTEKRLDDSLKKGKGPISRDLPTLLGMSAIWGALAMLSPAAARQLLIALQPFIEHPQAWSLQTANDAGLLLQYVTIFGFVAVLPIILAISLSGLTGSALQSRGIVLERIRPDFSRISPGAGWKRVFGAAGLSEGLKAIAKVAIVAAIAVWIIRDFVSSLMVSFGLGVDVMGTNLARLLARLTGGILLAFLVIAIVDLVAVRFFWRRGLRMTKQEVKEESKDSDGDPRVKGRMRMIAQQRLKKRMMAAVPRATVVIANPTHFAVALRYVRSEGGAPRVVAKGQDGVALKIRGLADKLDIPVVENKWLARSLYASVQIDAFIPPEFYKAVAQIISVLTKNGRQRTG